VPQPTLIFANFLSPVLSQTYQHIVEYVEEVTGVLTFLLRGESFDDFEAGGIDAGFVCGLAYVHLSRQQPSPVELVAAPILQGARYEQSPRYFSDIVVHKESEVHTCEDLRACTWAYNEKSSHSGYNVVQYNMLTHGVPLEKYFAKTIETGSHAQSLRLVLEGKASATAIDSHMLDVLLRDHPEIAASIRVVGSFGPSTIPPVVISRRLPPDLKQEIRETFLNMHRDRLFAPGLAGGLIERFTHITDAHYDDIREMYSSVQQHAALLRR
jgi:phosphonate transport system substrate-binding protein